MKQPTETQMVKTNGNALHVAIIMDGNGRWAIQRGLPRVAGHRAGMASVRRVVEHAVSANIAQLTLYAFSADNWRRPQDEVKSIFWLLRAFLRLEAKRLSANGVRLQVIGRRDRLDEIVLREIAKAEAITRGGNRLRLRVAIDYSSRDAIANAATQAAVETGMDLEELSTSAAQRMRNHVMKALGTEVDLLIRTGGEKRLSDFLLWESAYAELLFSDRMWPDFSEADLDGALEEFRKRQRRFGGVPSAAEEPCELERRKVPEYQLPTTLMR